MTLIRGSGGLCPCPRCLVPSASLAEPDRVYPMRDIDHIQDVVLDEELSKGEKDEILKPLGMRAVVVSLNLHCNIYLH